MNRLQKSDPVLSHSQLAFRIALARKRTSSYPMHKLDFIMMDLERPDMCSRQAHWCTGDLTGRLLEFLSSAEGVDGGNDPRLTELFERILRTKRPSGLFGRYSYDQLPALTPPEDCIPMWSYRLFNGLVKYYDLTGDYRAFEAVIGAGEWMLSNRDRFAEHYKTGADMPCPMEFWVGEPMAELYRLTNDARYLDFMSIINDRVVGCEHLHAHGFLATMRGLQLTAIYSGDKGWNEKPEHYRRKIIDQHYEMADGCVGEMMPRSFRNEGCTIADWLMLNLNAGLLSGSDEPYERAENILWNAMFFNQLVTGGFGHRDLIPEGYAKGAISEAWWCCTEHCGMALSEYARHAVTMRDNVVWINLLTSGTFKLGDIEVSITTSYPSRAYAAIRVKNLPEGASARVRIPPCIKNGAVREVRKDSGVILYLTGDLGHHVEPYEGKVLLKYGPLILSPQILYWNERESQAKSNIPAGYVPDFLPGVPAIAPASSNALGFLNFESGPIPVWSNFEMGPDAELCVEGASVNVPVVFDNGERKTLWFSPLCHATSNLSLYDTPILFK